jgi:hypothetical protein
MYDEYQKDLRVIWVTGGSITAIVLIGLRIFTEVVIDWNIIVALAVAAGVQAAFFIQDANSSAYVRGVAASPLVSVVFGYGAFYLMTHL